MKALITSLISMFIVVHMCSICAASDKENIDQKQALQSFQAIVDKFSVFFKGNPKHVTKEAFSESPNGITYSIVEYQVIDISYDIQKTDSLVSPFIGYFDVSKTLRKNSSCGNIKTKYDIDGWDNIEEALKNADNELCYRWAKNIPRSAPRIERYIFAYQSGKWIFKDAVYEDTNKKNGRLLAILGKPSGDYLEIVELSGKQYNQPWLDLINMGK